MRSAAKRSRPVRRRKSTSKKYRPRTMERVRGDESFQEGWGFSHDTSIKAHWFTPTVAGMRVSLCHVVLQAPVWILPSIKEDDAKCLSCQKFLERRRSLAKIKQERDLKRRLDSRIASFLADPLLGPRLYACPVCDTAYEGMAPQLFPCSEGGHAATMVVELVRKDTWTRDKAP